MAEHGDNKVNPLLVWLFTTNHKNVGILYLVTSLYFLVVAGILALIFRFQITAPEMSLLRPEIYNQMVTMHGLFMLLWVVTPLASAFANYFVPIQIGAKDMAYPRLNALSYWLYLASGIMALSSFFADKTADWGWTTYAPLNTLQYSPQAGGSLMGLAIVVLLASSIVATVNFMVTIFRLRAPGMRLFMLPLFSFFWLVTVFLMLWAFPAFVAPLIFLVTDRVFGTVFYTSVQGGALLWDHLFWFFGHPEVYILVLPGLAIAGDIISVFSGRKLYAKKVIYMALVAAAALSYIVWAHHMFMTGIDPGLREFFNITTELISIPFGIMMLSYIFTMYKGKVRLTTPMLFAMGAVALFIIGGASGVFNSSVALNFGLRGTFWVVAHFHYTIVGGGITGLIAGLYYWWPKITGRMYSEKLGKLHFILYIIGFNLLYFPMQALFDMPRRIYTYEAATGWGPINMFITMGGLVFGLTWLLFFYILIHSLKYGERVGDDPWNAKNYSLEWNVPSPPPEFNFPEGKIPVIKATGVEFMDVEEVRRMKLAGSTSSDTVKTGIYKGRNFLMNGGIYEGGHDDGHGGHSLHLSPWPMVLSAGVAMTFLGLFFGVGLFILGLVVFIASLAGWAWEDLKERFHVDLEALGETWPFKNLENHVVAAWMIVFGEIGLFGPLLAGYFFIRAMAARTGLLWPLPGQVHDIALGGINTIILLTSGLTMSLALLAIKRGNQDALKKSLVVTFLLGTVFLVIKGFEWSELFAEGITFSTDIISSLYFVLTGVHAAHVMAGLIGLIYLIIKAYKGGFTAEKHLGVEVLAIYWGFVDAFWLILYPLFYLI